MLLRHSLKYALARGVPGLINFGALALYTRLLAADEFGRYAVVIATVALVDVLLFQWLRLVINRFVPAHKDSPNDVLQPVLALFLALSALLTLVGLGIALLSPDPVWRGLIAIAIPLTIAQGWLQLNLSLAAAELAPVRYGLLMGSRSAIALTVGAGLALLGLGAFAPTTGLLVGALIAWLCFGMASWRGTRALWPSRATLREYCAYGLPLIITFALAWIIGSSDRLILGWLLGNAAVGVYSAGYDLAQNGLGVILVIVNIAAHPLVTNRLEREGQPAAVRQMRQNGELVVTLAIASAAGLVAVAPSVVQVLVGPDFRDGARAVVPLVAMSAGIAGIKSYHFDIAFHLTKQSRWLAITGVLAAIINAALNFLLIPRMGLVGAAWATLFSMLAAAVASAILGRRVFPMPGFLRLVARAAPVGALTFVGALTARTVISNTTVGLLVAVASGGVLALAGAFTLDVSELRTHLLSRIRVAFGSAQASPIDGADMTQGHDSHQATADAPHA